MTNRAALDAAFRLSQTSKVHVHERLDPASRRPEPSIIASEHKRGRRLTIGARQFRSVTAASRAFRTSPRQIYAWVREGRARFL